MVAFYNVNQSSSKVGALTDNCILYKLILFQTVLCCEIMYSFSFCWEEWETDDKTSDNTNNKDQVHGNLVFC